MSWYLAIALVKLTSSASILDGEPQCKCVPDQWQGVLTSLEREFDLEGGRMGSSESNLYASYDYEGGMFSITDMKSGHRAVADYTKGYKYIIREGMCRGIHTGEDMVQMCLPDYADYLGEFSLGTNLPVDIWQFMDNNNISQKTNVIQRDCVPVSEEVYSKHGSYVSISNSLYLDVSVGINDRKVFEVPKNCMIQTMPTAPQHIQQRKRSRSGDDIWSLKDLLKMN